LGVYLDVSAAPEIQRDVEGGGDDECYPEPDVFAPDGPLEVAFTDRTPVLSSHALAARHSMIRPNQMGERTKTYRCWRLVVHILPLVDDVSQNDHENDEEPYSAYDRAGKYH
jgi:hypothetical protein